MISQYCIKPNSSHIALFVQILKYMYGTLHYDLTYTKSQSKFVDYTNVD